MSVVFKFKQFEVDQTDCAMKINTDGVLLAAMAKAENPSRILDIGTGTGVMALMLAQRFTNATIEAVEVDGMAAKTASINFKNAVFADRLTAHHTDILNFESANKFDLIVSNPPYFINDLKNAEHKKGIARHTDEQFFNGLIAKVANLLKENGVFWFILPVKQAQLLIQKAQLLNFNVAQLVYLHSDVTKPAFRLIVCLSKAEMMNENQHFYIYEREKVYTDSYKMLLKDFFLGY